jgi:hypothetical protein
MAFLRDRAFVRLSILDGGLAMHYTPTGLFRTKKTQYKDTKTRSPHTSQRMWDLNRIDNLE